MKKGKTMKQNFVILSILLISGQLGAFTAFENGKWQADIILPDRPDHAEIFAADELQYHLGKMLGVKPAIVRESGKSAQSWHFYIGNTSAARAAGIEKKKLALDSHRIKTVKDGIVFVGGDRNGLRVGNHWSAACQGTLYAVYSYLENELGVKWIWPGELGEVIPVRSKLETGSIDRAGQEPLTARRMRVAGRKAPCGWTTQENRDRFIADQDLFLIRHRMGASENLFYGHAFGKFWRKYGKTHPEFFALLINGKREPLRGDPAGEYITMCVSNPGLHQEIIRFWEQEFKSKKNADPPLINLCENDTPGMCICEQCRAWDAPDPRFAESDYWGKKKDPLTLRGRFYRLSSVKWGEDGDKATIISEPPSLSDRYAKFYMAVLKKARQIHAKARVIAYAYANYTDAPRETGLDKDVILVFVPGTGFPYSERSSAVIRKQIDGWCAAGIRKFVFRPNYMLLGGNMPYNAGRIIIRDFAYAADKGMIGTNFDSLTGVWANQGITLYSLIRAHRQPDFGYEKSLKEYVSAFAPAEKEISGYLEFWEKFTASVSEAKYRKICTENPDDRGNAGGGFRSFYSVSADLYPPEIFIRAGKLLDAASRQAAGNGRTLKRIDFLRKGLKDAELTRNCRAAEKQWKNCKDPGQKRELKKKFLTAFQTMTDFRKSVETDQVCNYGHFAVYERTYNGLGHKNFTKRSTGKK